MVLVRNKLLMLLAVIMLMLSGCANQEIRYRSSIIDYLYPDQDEPIQLPQIPLLSLPLKVGVAFVPNQSQDSFRTNGISVWNESALTEQEKISIMREVSKRFKQYDFVHSIEIIPSAYLRRSGGFLNLKQLRTLYGLDVMALLSYDQTQFTNEGFTSITYWTLIGAYVVRGEKNDTHTMLDAAVFEIKSQKLLFRAPGISVIHSSATPINLSEQLRKDRSQGFIKASEDLTESLEFHLQLFQEKVKENPDDYEIIYKPEYKGSYRGGGSLDLSVLLLIAVLGVSYLLRSVLGKTRLLSNNGNQ